MARGKADGDGLTFTRSADGVAGWILRNRHGGRRRERTAGRYPDIRPAEARGIASLERAEVQQGRHPAAEKQKAKATAARDLTVPDPVKDDRATERVSGAPGACMGPRRDAPTGNATGRPGPGIGDHPRSRTSSSLPSARIGQSLAGVEALRQPAAGQVVATDRHRLGCGAHPVGAHRPGMADLSVRRIRHVRVVVVASAAARGTAALHERAARMS